MIFKKYIFYTLLLLICISVKTFAAKHLEQQYIALKQSNCSDRICADSLFKIIYFLADDAPQKIDSLSADFIDFAAKQPNNNYLNAKAALASAYVNSFIQYNLNRSFKHAQKAIRIFEQETSDKDLCFAYQILANIYTETGNYQLADETELKALQIGKKLNNPVLISNSYNALAINYNFEKKYDKAKQVFSDMLQLLEHSTDTASKIRALLNMGTSFRNLHQFDSAFYYNKKGLDLAISVNDTFQMAYAYNDLGSFYVYQKQAEKSLPFLQKAMAIREALNEGNELFWTYSFLGDAYAEMHQTDNGQLFYHKAIQLASKNNKPTQQYEAYQRLSNLYANAKLYDSAYFYNDKYAILKDSVSQARKDIATDIFIANYELGEKEQKILRLDEHVKHSQTAIQRQQMLLFFAVVLLIILIVIVFLIRKLKQQQISKILLEQQLQEESSKLLAEENLRKEKERIARDLHDNVGSQLTYIIYSIDGINDYDSPQRKEIAANIGTSVRQVVANLRETIWLIHENGTCLQDFADRLNVFARKLFKPSATKVNFEENIKSDPPLNALLSLNLYRICQEILTNALKHAQACEVLIHLNYDQNKLSIHISDNGIGFDTAINNSQGYGLANIEKRASESGIILERNTQFNKGTSYTISIFLNN